MSKEVEHIDISIEKMDKRFRPFSLIKKALASFSVLLMIGSGILINWILAILFLINYISITSILGILGGLFVLIVVFPVAYCYAAYTYGQSVVLFEVYQEVIRPVVANIIAGILNRVLKDDTTLISSQKVQDEFEQQSNSLLDKIPNLITNQLELVAAIKDVIVLVTEQYKQGGEKEVVKNRIVNSVFNLLDTKMDELVKPSLVTFFIIGGINLIVAFFIF